MCVGRDTVCVSYAWADAKTSSVLFQISPVEQKDSKAPHSSRLAFHFSYTFPRQIPSRIRKARNACSPRTPSACFISAKEKSTCLEMSNFTLNNRRQGDGT
ncbi:hypothetical protein NDU88_002412 [Pleurodeles waltl]|uniref:Uncharacterized protein n=1 Tax=Pleurodeles waltl TaxID=8319 RepID=A0AAV7NDK7_PLEWA|nr:hypothetical protein NDU88_002412 [Pleurodeles waltl]